MIPQTARRSDCRGARAALGTLAVPGGFSGFLCRRARVRGIFGGFPELPLPRAGILLQELGKPAAETARRLHGDSGSRETCRQSPKSLHGGPQTRKTCQRRAGQQRRAGGGGRATVGQQRRAGAMRVAGGSARRAPRQRQSSSAHLPQTPGERAVPTEARCGDAAKQSPLAGKAFPTGPGPCSGPRSRP